MGRFIRAAILFVICLDVPAPTRAVAQPVFFDDFDGDALLPHWELPRPGDWEYNVSNSMLNVTALHYPSSPKDPGNFAAMGALFQPQGDFRMDSRMGWEAGSSPHRLLMIVEGSPAGGLATFGYWNDPGIGSDPLIFASAGGQAFTIPAPDSGTFEFSIRRSGREFEFFLDGIFLVRFPVNFDLPAGGVGFHFVGPYPGPLGAFHIDHVQVVPTPGAFGTLAILLLFFANQRQRKPSLSPQQKDRR